MSAAPRLFWRSLGLAMSLAVASAVPARAQIDGLEWLETEIIDAEVLSVPASGGPSAAHTPWWEPWRDLDEWHVVYAKDGEIYRAVRDDGGWQPPERLSFDAADSRDPKLAFSAGLLHVTWEDDRTGRPEIWTRRWNGAAWSVEECLTPDDSDSRSASLAGAWTGAVLAWQDGPDETSAVMERIWNGASWSAPITIAQGSYAAREPSVCPMPWDDSLVIHAVYWSDTRYGLSEILGRRVYEDGSMDEVVRMTDLPGSCRHPSARSLICCGDMIGEQIAIAFENDASGVNETFVVGEDYWGVGVPYQVSDPGTPSERPSIHGFQFNSNLGMGGTFPRFFMTWTETTAPGTRDHVLLSLGDAFWADGRETYSEAGRSFAGIATSQETPKSEILLMTIESISDVPSLVAHRAATRSCLDPTYELPDAIVVAPEGIPDNLLVVRDHCEGGNGFIEDVPAQLRFDPITDAAVTWDVTQQHPNLPERWTDENGEARWGIRGGGCTTGGYVGLYIYGIEVLRSFGVRSPDVNGDCAVRVDDLAYVQGHVGGADPCADIDGSGLVDASDVAIVQATLGDLCSQLTGVDDAAASGAGFRVVPNPCATQAVFLAGPGARGAITIVDAAGRIVRRLGAAESVWDLRDTGGRRVAPGIYFASRETGNGAPAQRRMIAVLP